MELNNRLARVLAGRPRFIIESAIVNLKRGLFPFVMPQKLIFELNDSNVRPKAEVRE
jgi:hypothetical protein